MYCLLYSFPAVPDLLCGCFSTPVLSVLRVSVYHLCVCEEVAVGPLACCSGYIECIRRI
jgi:hypothetical protein